MNLKQEVKNVSKKEVKRMTELKGEVCVITGAARGIGLAIAELLLNVGVKVVLCDKDKQALTNLEQNFNNTNVLLLACDVTKEDEIIKVANVAEEQLGPIDIWINNAGIARHRPITEYTKEEIDWMFDVNVKGTIFGSQQAFKRMKSRKSGQIINIISTAALRGIPSESVYCATKFAVRGFTQALHEEAAPYHIRVSSVLPGGVNITFWDQATNGHPLVNQFLKPEQVAQAVLNVLQMDLSVVTNEIILRSISDTDFAHGTELR